MNPQRILVILPSWVGDVVMATPALRALRGQFPSAHVAYLHRAYLDELLSGLTWFDERIHWPRNGHPSVPEMLRLAAALRKQRFDLAILFTNSFRSAALVRLAGVPRRIGFAREGRGWLLTDRLRAKRHGRQYVPAPMLDYYRELVEAAGCRMSDQRLELVATPAEEAALDVRLAGEAGTESRSDPHSSPDLLVLNPGASYGIAKCWLAERYAELAARLAERHDLRVIVSCSPSERSVADAVRAAACCPMTIFADPPLGLGPLKALVRRARLMITNDTGPRHFAAAFNTPVVTVFGSSDPAWTECNHPLERKVMVQLDCQPCMQRVCPLGHHNCMKDVTVDMVQTVADRLLAETRHAATPPRVAAGTKP